MTACSSSGDDGDGSDRTAGGEITQQPKDANPFWVNPEGTAAQQMADLRADGKKAEAEQIRKIAEQPAAEWISPENPEEQARGFTEAADKAGRTALLVLYNIPHRDCGQYCRAVPPTATPTAPSSTAWPRASGTGRRP